MKKGKLISSGHYAEIFTYGADHILKLYYPQFGEQQAVREGELTSLAYEAGAPAPQLKNIIQAGDRTGLVIEYIKGPTMTEVLAKQPWKIFHFAGVFARLHANIHKLSGTGFPSQKDTMRFLIHQSKGRLGERAKNILKRFEGLPEGYRLCHNDFHQENIIFSHRGPVLIDWAEALSGHPYADVVHALLVQERPVPVPGKPNASCLYTRLHNRHRRWFSSLYVKEYCKLTGASQKEISKWILPVSAARMVSKPSNEKDWTEAFIHDRWRLLKNRTVP